MAETILVDTNGGITTITLNRPDKLNAWTRQIANEVRSTVGVAGNDSAVRCIVVSGGNRWVVKFGPEIAKRSFKHRSWRGFTWHAYPRLDLTRQMNR